MTRSSTGFIHLDLDQSFLQSFLELSFNDSGYFLIDLPNKTVEGRVGCRSLDKSPIFS